MAKKNNNWILILLVVIGIVLFVRYSSNFAIVDTDFVYEGVTVYQTNSPSSPYTYDNGTITFYMNAVPYNFTSGSIYYTLDNQQTIFPVVPTPANGTHIIRKNQITYEESNSQITLTRWLLAMKTEQVIEQPEQIVIEKKVNQTVYVNQTVEVVKEVKIDPTFLEKYGIALAMLFIFIPIIIWLGWSKK